MAPHHSTRDPFARGPGRALSAPLHATKMRVLGRSMKAGALCTFLGLASSMMVAPTQASAAPFGGVPFAPGSVIVAQGGTIAGNNNTGTPGTVEADGSVNVYPPDANGDVAPEVSFTNGMTGPFVAIFDPLGDMWVANENTSTIVEFTRAQLATPNPVPAVTISSATGALTYPTGMAFDSWGNLWVVADNNPGRVYEYAKWQLARTGSPTPVASISDLPGTPLGDAFDPWGDLWVTVQLSSSCPNGCVVEFSLR